MLKKAIEDLQSVRNKHFEDQEENDGFKSSELLGVTSISHGGKSFFFDNMKDNGFTFGNEDEEWPLCKTGQSLGYTLDKRFTRIFRKNGNGYSNHITNEFGSNRNEGRIRDIADKYPDIRKWSNFRMINFIRDPRIVWILENHFGCFVDGRPNKLDENELNSFIDNEVLVVFDHYQKYKDYSLTIKFEDYISNFFLTQSKILDYLEIESEIKRSSEQLTSYFTTIEPENICFYTKHSQDFLDEISLKTKDYLTEFGYEERLTLDRIFQTN